MIEKYTFDESAHTYTMTRNGITHALASVTTIIRDVLPQWTPNDPWYMQRGTEVHKAAEIIAQDKVPVVDPEIQGHVDGIHKFYDDFGVLPIAAEQQVYHPRLMYAGTLDLYAQCDHHQYAMIDFKSSGDERACALQLAAYTLDGLVGAPSDKPIPTGIMVTLPGDGTYKAKVFNLGVWWPRWRAVLTVYNLKRVAV